MRHDEKVHRSTRPAARFLVARLGWIVVVAVAVTAGAALLSWSRTPMYQSKAEVLVEGRTPGASTATAPDMGTERAVAASGTVLTIAAAALRVASDDLARGLTVTVPVDTHLLQITDTHEEPEEARRRAQGVAEAYVAFRSTSSAGEPAKAGAKPSPSAAAKTTAAGGATAEVITPAPLPAAPASPDHLVDLGVALVIGLCLGIGAALARDRLDDHLRGPADLAAHVQAPTLALLPAFRAPRRDLPGRLVTVRSPGSRVAGAYRDLRSRVCQVAVRRGAGTLLVTSPAGEDRSTVTANLAVALATSGRTVVLVCADPARSRSHEYFALDTGDGNGPAGGGSLDSGNGPAGGDGLAGVLDGRVALAAELRRTAVPGLSVLPAGSGAALELDRPALPGMLAELRSRADFVLVDGPPVLAGADAAGLAEHADMVLVVADARRTTRRQVDAALLELAHAHAKVIGAVLDNVGRRGRLPRSRPAPSVPAPAPDPDAAPAVPAPAPDPDPAGTTDQADRHRDDPSAAADHPSAKPSTTAHRADHHKAHRGGHHTGEPAVAAARYRVPDATGG